MIGGLILPSPQALRQFAPGAVAGSMAPLFILED